ncbi:hypothetical protein SBRCBS47491_003421 [Sporothrix bragantina]|uniref:DUF3533 domain-containing protein n=1 Tax=Sporothrix bragantina TaxID=671064 RepID=A0ABP0BGC2_9PEZI
MENKVETNTLSSTDEGGAADNIEMQRNEELERVRLNDTFWNGKRKGIIMPMVMMGVIILICFLMIMSNFFGSAFEQNKRVKAINILAVDYDGGVIGTSFANAYKGLQADSFPTVEFRSASEFPDAESIRNAVCHGDYWAGTYVPPNASKKLSEALQGGSAAANYNSLSAFTYIYNDIRYPTVAEGFLASNLATWIGAARGAYYQADAGSALFGINQTDAASIAAYLDPITYNADLIQPTTQGSRVYYNTAFMVPPCLAPFFLIMALNGISLAKDVFTRLSIRDVWLLRFAIGKGYTFVASLVFAGYLWAFRENWDVGSRQFVLTWMVMWLDLEVNWVIMESVIASYIPLAFVAIFVVSWVMVNVASAIFPFILSAGWFRWGYLLPAHETYVTLIYVWSGCVNPLRYSLPIMFSWLVLGHVTAFFSIRKRCIDAQKMLRASLAGKEN